MWLLIVLFIMADGTVLEPQIIDFQTEKECRDHLIEPQQKDLQSFCVPMPTNDEK